MKAWLCWFALMALFSAGPVLPTSGAAQAEDLPIIDAHSHTERGMNVEAILPRLDAGGVRKIVLFARRGGSDEGILSLHTKYPERVVPTVGFQNPGWVRQEAGFLDEVEAKLRTGRFWWLGELLLKHYAVPELQAPTIVISPDTDLFRRALDLAARYRVPLTVHHEAEPGNIELFRRILRHNPTAVVVWAHWCGRPEPAVARSFLQEFPNLHCDLGGSHGRFYARGKNPLADEAGVLRPEWSALIEAFPERFLAGIDAIDPTRLEYEQWVAMLRRALAGLSSGTARRVGFENAERLLARRTR